MAPEQAPADDAAMLRADLAARVAALDTTRSFLLQAPAGSGKTTVLTCRLLALLGTVDAPEEVLAITFTRKAAAEMRTRVLKALRCAADGAAGNPEEAPHAAAALRRDRTQQWNLLDTPARLRVMTIDAYCQTLAAQLPIASRSGLRLEVATPATALYAAAARRTLERALDDAELVGAAQLLFARLDNDWPRLEELLILMLAQRAHWLPRVLGGDEVSLPARVAASLRVVIEERLTAALQALPADLNAEGSTLARHAAQTLAAGDKVLAAGARAWLDDARPLRGGADDLLRWRFQWSLTVTGKGEWRKSWDSRTGFTPDHKAQKQRLAAWVAALAALPAGQAVVNELLALPDPQIAADDVAALQALSQLLRAAAVELQLEFASRGRVDFAAIAGAARAALTADGAPTDLGLRCGDAIRHLLIDEFQDTSLDQFELLRALTAAWEPGDGRTLFAVGDPMQSIYQFREAEVGLFLRARDAGIGALRLEPLQLRRNFRSAPQLVDWVNRHCGAIFPVRDDVRLAAIRYQQALAAQTDLPGTVTLQALGSADPESEAARIVALVRACRARDAHCTVAVLVSTRRQAAPIAAALQRAGIAIRGVNLEPLRERPVVRDLCSLARALQHPGDRSAWLALLHAPACGLSLAALQTLCEGQAALVWELCADAERLATLDADDRRRLQRLRTALAAAIDGPERALPLWQRVDRAWLRLGGPATCAAATQLQDAQAFIQALAAEARAPLLAGDAFDEFAADLYAQPAAARDAVEILTLHGAKGLEWDVVIVPGIGRAQRSDREPLLHWLELPGLGAEPELLLAPISATDEDGAGAHSLAQYIVRLRAQRGRLEKARLLYVAATRARRELHWLGHAAPDSDGAPQPRAGTALAMLWPALGAQFLVALEPLPTAVLQATTEAAAAVAVATAWRLPADWQPAALPAAAPAARLRLSLQESATEPEYLWVGQTARAVGTVVHAELQRLARQPPLATAPDVAASDYHGWFAELGVPVEERAAAGLRVRAALAATLADERGRWLLGEQHAQAYSELRMTGLHDGRVVNIVIDRLLVTAEGTRWIIDYKTSQHEGGDLAGFLERETERYRPQLVRYATLVAAQAGGPVRTALYFPLLGAFREVGLQPPISM